MITSEGWKRVEEFGDLQYAWLLDVPLTLPWLQFRHYQPWYFLDDIQFRRIAEKFHFQERMAGLVPTQLEFNHQCFPLYRFATEPHSMFWNCIAILSLLSAVGNPKVNYSFESWHRRSWTSSVALNSLAPGWHWGERWKTSSFNLQPIPLSKHHFGLKSAPISKYDTFIF